MVTSGTRIEVEAAVWVRTSCGWQRAHGWWAASEEGPAVWEVATREDSDGQVELSWLADEAIGAVIVVDPAWRPSRRDQVEAIADQVGLDIQRARARLAAKAPKGWQSRS